MSAVDLMTEAAKARAYMNDSGQAEHESEVAQFLGQDIQTIDFGYTYPKDTDGNELDFRPGSDLSKSIVLMINNYVLQSQAIKDRHVDECREIDRMHNVFIPMSEWEAKQKGKDPRAPMPVVLPLGYQLEETWLAFMMATWTNSGMAVHQYKSDGGRKEKIGAAFRERIIAKHSLHFKERLALLTACRDSYRYSVGLAGIRWKKDRGCAVRQEKTTKLLYEALRAKGVAPSEIRDQVRYFEEDVITFAGNELVPFDYYNSGYDSHVTPERIQDAEFIWWNERDDALKLMQREQDPDERLFNGYYVRIAAAQGRGKMGAYPYNRLSGRQDRYGGDDYYANMTQYKVDTVEGTNCLVRLIPWEKRLGGKRTPEVWHFKVIGDVVVKADRLNLHHGMHPVAAFAPSSDGHSTLPTSRAALAYGPQKVADFMARSRVDNVMIGLNNRWGYDPTVFKPADIQNPKLGFVPSLKPMWGTGENLAKYMFQFPVSDMTQNNMKLDLPAWIQIAKEGLGTIDLAAGDMSKLPERPGSLGVHFATSAGMSRFKLLATVIGEQAMRDIAWQFSYNVDQFMDETMQLSMTGHAIEPRIIEEYGKSEDIPVGLFDLATQWDVIPYDGSIPGVKDSSQQAELVKIILANKEFQMEYLKKKDCVALVDEFFSDNGYDVRSFNIQPQIQSAETIQQQLQAGNLKAMGGED